MIRRLHPASSAERGMVLISALLLLVVVTILAVGLFRSFGIDEKIAGNTREKQRALQAAVSAQQYAEWWLSNGNGGSSIACSTVVAASVGQVCTTALTNFASLPWQTSGGANVGVTYTPPSMTVSTSAAAGTYYATPAFYITYLGLGTSPNGGQGLVYQIDALGYGGSPNTAAVVESTYIVQSTTNCLSCNQ
jgi:type IV pilus assembly protein PilX